MYLNTLKKDEMYKSVSEIVGTNIETVKKFVRENADEIVVITDDGIKEQGTHQQLLDKGGIYAELYAYQFAESSLQ